MGDTLFGKEVSGTPLETRGLAADVAGGFQSAVNDPAALIGQMFGINPAELGLQEGFQNFLSGGSSTGLAGFNAANQPFRDRALSQSRAQNAGQFGTAGGRNSRNLSAVNAASDTQLNQGFDVNNFNFLNQARQTDLQGLLGAAGMLPGLANAALQPLAQAGQFAQVGAPIFQQGIAGELLGSLGVLGGAAIGNPGAFSFLGNLFGGGDKGGGTVQGGTGRRIPRPVADLSQFIPEFQPSFPNVSIGGPSPVGR